MLVLILGHTAVPPTHDSAGVAITGSINGRLVTGTGGAYLHEMAQTIGDHSSIIVPIYNQKQPTTHATDVKVALATLSLTAVDSSGSFGAYRVVKGVLPVSTVSAPSFTAVGSSTVIWLSSGKGVIGALLHFPI